MKYSTLQQHNKTPLSTPPKRAYLVTPILKNDADNIKEFYKHNEAKQLLRTINASVIIDEIAYITRPHNATFLGKGAIDKIQAFIHNEHDELGDDSVPVIMINTELSGVQQRNIEDMLQHPIHTRTSLILSIFAMRARSEEGKLQVKLAQHQYEQTRLKGKWSHLERQRGGTSATGGPGEKQIEIDKRLIRKTIDKLQLKVKQLQKRRTLQRKKRKNTPVPVIALVGYSNAGKSTLFNYLTQSQDYADNLLFATLDTHMRKTNLPSKRQIIIADTVGFISDLPPILIDAFRATLEELYEATLILHICDISSDTFYQQKKQVNTIMESLGLATHPARLTVGNKVDAAHHVTHNQDCDITISAITGQNIDNLTNIIDEKLDEIDAVEEYHLHFNLDDTKKIHQLYNKGQVTSCVYNEDGVEVTVRLSSLNAQKLLH